MKFVRFARRTCSNVIFKLVGDIEFNCFKVSWQNDTVSLLLEVDACFKAATMSSMLVFENT